jgi:hypothetical protein
MYRGNTIDRGGHTPVYVCHHDHSFDLHGSSDFGTVASGHAVESPLPVLLDAIHDLPELLPRYLQRSWIDASSRCGLVSNINLRRHFMLSRHRAEQSDRQNIFFLS